MAPAVDCGVGRAVAPATVGGLRCAPEKAVIAMRRQLLVRRPVPTDLAWADAVFSGDPGAWLPDPARPRGLDCWTVDLGAGPATRSVTCRVGGVWRTGDGTWRSLRWRPEAEPDDLVPVPNGLPGFHGEVGLVDRDGSPELLLRGYYSPPGGWLGSLADVTVMRTIAPATGRRFLDDIAERLHEHRGVDRPGR